MRVQRATTLLLLIVSSSFDANPPAAQTASESTLVRTATAETVASAEKPLPTTDEVLERYRAATGGSEVWSRFTTRATKGIYQTEDLSGFAGIEIIEKAPNRSFRKTTFSNGTTIREICDGESVWVEDAAGNRLEFTGAALESRLHAAVFGNRGDFLARSSPGRVLGIAQVGTHSTYVVSFSPETKISSKVYFDRETAWVVRVDDVFHRDDGDYLVETDVDDYRPVDGAYFPYRIRHVERGNIYTIRVTQIKNNVAVDDTLFAKP
ncbi:MAG TPA: hypothetical protein VEJ45_12010 [Candidatus Acidoferrales bacterium]|nr:hypothetical protein [Candidatus Acidoferrales bacterium]